MKKKKRKKNRSRITKNNKQKTFAPTFQGLLINIAFSKMNKTQTKLAIKL